MASLLEKLKNYWKQLPDPLDERILTTLTSICQSHGDTRLNLLSKYKSLVKVSGSDIAQIIDELINCVMESPATLECCVKLALTSYTLASARNAQAEVDIKTQSTYIIKQKEAFDKSLDHMSNSWEAVADSITKGVMKAIDEKTLGLTNLNQTQNRSGPASSTASHKTDAMVGSTVRFERGSCYSNKIGLFKILPNGNYEFIAASETGYWIEKLTKRGISLQVFIQIMNKDLDLLADFLRTKLNEYTLSTLHAMPAQVATKWLSGMIEQIPKKQGQWTLCP